MSIQAIIFLFLWPCLAFVFSILWLYFAQCCHSFFVIFQAFIRVISLDYIAIYITKFQGFQRFVKKRTVENFQSTPISGANFIKTFPKLKHSASIPLILLPVPLSEIDCSAVQSFMQSWRKTGEVGNAGPLNSEKIDGLMEEVVRVEQ